eukprot:gene12474-6223_t
MDEQKNKRRGNTKGEPEQKKQKIMTEKEKKKEYFEQVREQYLKEVILTFIGKYHLFQYKSFRTAIKVIEKYEEAIQNDLIFSLIKSVCYFHLGDYKKCKNIIDSIRTSDVRTKDDEFAQKVANFFYMDTNGWTTVEKVPIDALYPVSLMFFKIFGLNFDFSDDISTLSISHFLIETQKSLKNHVLMREDTRGGYDGYKEYKSGSGEEYTEEEEEEGYIPFVENDFEYLKKNVNGFDEDKFEDYFKNIDKDIIYYNFYMQRYDTDDEADDEADDEEEEEEKDEREHKQFDVPYMENFEFIAQKDKIFIEDPHEMDSEGYFHYRTLEEEFTTDDSDSSDDSYDWKEERKKLLQYHLERVKKETFFIFIVLSDFVDFNTEEVKLLIDIYPPIFLDFYELDSECNFHVDELIIHALNINCGLIKLLPQNLIEKYFMTAYKLNKKIVHLFTSKQLLKYQNEIDDYEIPKLLNFWNVKFYFG